MFGALDTMPIFFTEGDEMVVASSDLLVLLSVREAALEEAKRAAESELADSSAIDENIPADEVEDISPAQPGFLENEEEVLASLASKDAPDLLPEPVDVDSSHSEVVNIPVEKRNVLKVRGDYVCKYACAWHHNADQCCV